MDATVSVSKGCFVFKNGATRADKSTKKSAKRRKSLTSTAVLGKDIMEQPFYGVYTEIWHELQADIERLQKSSYTKTMSDLVNDLADNDAMEQNIRGVDEILPAAALLTGINQPDHLEQFETLSQYIHEKMSASVCMLQSRDCSTLKAAVEAMVYNFMEAPFEDDEDRDHKRLRRSQCTMKQLVQWYDNNYAHNKKRIEDSQDEHMEQNIEMISDDADNDRHLLVVILPDFECFNSLVLQDLILILSAHCAQLPFALILGVATGMSAVHNTLPFHVIRKIKLRVYEMQAAPVALNEILERVALSPKNAFHLSGKTFKFLTHIFLYYDFSINGFVHGFKYCLMEHFFQGNAFALCTNYTASLTKIKCLTHADMETMRRFLSFRPYVERINDCKRVISILTDDNYLKKKLPQLLRDCHIHFMLFRTFLEFLTVLVGDLPKCPLGKLCRELYALTLSKELFEQPEFKECWQILSFMSKQEFVAKISLAIKATEKFASAEIAQLELGANCMTVITEKLSNVKELLTKVVMAGTETKESAPNTTSTNNLKELSSRQDLKDKLLQMSKQEKAVSEFTKCLNETLAYIQSEIVVQHLIPLQRAPPLHELFVFSDLATVRRHIIGSPRAALHVALNNPHFYMQCKCCHLQQNAQLLATLPDLSVVYKLHLECGRMINLFDWLQAFRAVVDFEESEDQEQIDPQIQARFTRAVAELQFLGYIKMSKRKTDHATRLTW